MYSFARMRGRNMATKNISPDLFKIWGKNEKAEFIKFCRSLLQNTQHNSPAFQNGFKALKHVLYDVCWKAVHGIIPIETTVSALGDVVHLHTDLPSAIADILLLLDTESQCTENRDVRERFFWLLKGCNKKVVPECIIKERLDFESIGDAGIIKVIRSTQTKFIKIKTRLFYKQQKFNLFREESEGYGKLIAELNQENGNKLNVAYVLEVIKSLIGCFNLDPNRVLDIILESFECRLDLMDFFIPLLQSFSCTSSTLSQVIGFKFSFYQHDSTVETPGSLYKVTALLLKSKLISLNQLYDLLVPDDSRIIEKHKQELMDAQVYARRINVVSTTSEKTDENKEQSKEEDNQWEEDNQKLGLCAALLDVGDWEHAQQLMACLPDFYAISHQYIAKKLCTLIHVVIDSLYKKYGLSIQLKSKTKLHLEVGIQPPQIQNFIQLRDVVFPMVLALGPHLHLDPVLMVKIIRLNKAWLNQKSSLQDSGNKEDIVNILDESLLPSLSLLECNCCMAEELWSLLKLFPYQYRYHLYSQWKSTAHLSHPLLIRTKADTLKKLKYIMKRLSKENVKPSGRQIGKLSHSNPGYLFDYILSQIQTWDNLITPVVDSLKYLTSLSYDVLAYCVIEALANPEKDRMKHDGASISIWLQSLASFGGAVFRKYTIDLTGLLQYVTNQLKAQKSLDLLILKEIVQKMAGIEASEEMTPEQIEAMAGGELLRAEGGYFNQLRNTKKSSQRLKEALLEQDLALPLCLLMAQQRKCILYHEQEQSHLKLVGKLYDQCQDTLVQFGSFLASSLNMDDYVHRLPSVAQLLSDYYIQADVAFFLVRPMFNYVINSKFDEMRKQVIKSMSTAQKLQKYLEAVESITSPIVQSIRPLQSPKTWEDLSPQFYITFWSLAMYDLTVPSASYEREINKLKTQVTQSEDNKDASKKKKEKERCDALIVKLLDEEKKQHDHCARVLARLKNEKDNWFQSRSAKNETITQFLQLCVFPRCIFTPVDALYCAKFVHLIHALKTPNFSTLICYDRIFCDITYTVTACTENEANRYGRFLCAMLETVMKWHSDKSIFEKECANFPGFMTKFRGATQSSDSATDHVDYENYRHVCHKWHFKITKALVICLESGDYVQIRNSLIVLIKMLPCFPVVANLGQALERRIDKIRQDEREKRPDIYALATGYSGQLKGKKPNLIPESEFHLKETKETSRCSSSSGTVKTDTSSKTGTSVTAKDFDISDKADFVKEKDAKHDLKGDFSRSSGAKSCPGGKPNTTGQSNSQSSGKASTAKVLYRDNEQNGTDAERIIKIERHKEEKSSLVNSSSPLRREDRTIVKSESTEKSQAVKEERRDRRDDHYDKLERSSLHHSSEVIKDADYYKDATDGSQGSHAHRRTGDINESDRDHKRRRVDGTSSKSPRTDDRPREGSERELRSSDKLREEERSASREKQPSEKTYRETETPTEKEKQKVKEKKVNRKRDYSDDSSSETKRRKDEDAAKRNGENEIREREQRHRREETSTVLYDRNRESRERRLDREDKKQHRSTSTTIIKKRS